MKRALIFTNLFWLSFAIASGVFSANVLHRTADPVVYRRSVNEPDFPTSNWFHDPDISAVQSVPRKYWRRPLTNPVTEMTGPEKAVVDAQLSLAEANAQKARAKQSYQTTDQQGANMDSGPQDVDSRICQLQCLCNRCFHAAHVE
jgi:hypothetical protein